MFIYKIENTINHKVYIGQDSKSSSKNYRWKSHQNSITSNSNTHLVNALKKYGLDNFDYSVVYDFTGILNRNSSFHRIILDWYETQTIEFYNSYETGYNMTRGGDGVKIDSYDRYTEDIKNKRISELSKWAKEQNDIKWSTNRVQSLEKLHETLHTEEVYEKKSMSMKKYWNDNTIDKTNQLRGLKNQWIELDKNERRKRTERGNGLFCAKEYLLIDENFNEYITSDIKGFCSTRGLEPTTLRSRARNKSNKLYKGWKCRYAND